MPANPLRCYNDTTQKTSLSNAEGHPAAVMDMSFADQALSVEYLVKGERGLAPDVHPVPAAIDATVARLNLEAMGIAVDALTPEQERYLCSWTEGI